MRTQSPAFPLTDWNAISCPLTVKYINSLMIKVKITFFCWSEIIAAEHRPLSCFLLPANQKSASGSLERSVSRDRLGTTDTTGSCLLEKLRSRRSFADHYMK